MNRSRLCLVLTGTTLQKNLETLDRYKDLIDLVEVRADFLDRAELGLLDRIPQFINCEAILTIRLPADGGHFTGSEEERLALYRQAVRGTWTSIDLETDTHDAGLEAECARRRIRIIRSFHDFDGVPDDLAARVNRVPRREIAKAAVMPKSSAEVNQFLSALKKIRRRNNILLCMGSLGTPTRILATKIGSWLTYCAAPAAEGAPGQIDPAAMYYIYRFAQISRRTKLFGIIGNPVAHSFSPRLHNKAYRDLDLDSVYVPFQVDNVQEFAATARLLDIRGFSVTIPHKASVIRLLAERDPLVETIRACNTVLRKKNGLCGFNTDVAGFLKPLAAYFNPEMMKSLAATVIGSGGAARSAIWGLRNAGASVLILNRTVEKAKMLADEFGCDWAPLGNAGFAKMRDHADLIVQTTDVGMEPDTQNDPLEGYQFDGHELVYDLIYAPRLTKLLERALGAGCKVINGEEMLVAQAHEQFRLFTGRESTFQTSVLSEFMNVEEGLDGRDEEEEEM